MTREPSAWALLGGPQSAQRLRLEAWTTRLNCKKLRDGFRSRNMPAAADKSHAAAMRSFPCRFALALHQKPRQTFRPWPAKLCVCVNLHASGSHAALKFRLGEHLAIYIQDFDACFERLLQRGRWKEMSCHAFQTRNVGVELNRPLKVLSG